MNSRFSPHRTVAPTEGCTGFTLVELIVTLGIIALVIGLIVPAFRPAVAASKRVICTSNLRQIGIAVEQYRTQRDGHLPIVQTLPVDANRPTAMDALIDYFPKGTSWQCPSDQETFSKFETSYEYFVGLMLNLMNEDQQKEFFASTDGIRGATLPVFQDAEGWHPGGPGGLDRNALYLDGHVDWLEASTPPVPTP